MASSLEFIEYIAGQSAKAGNITYRKMFGEYGMYCDGKFFALVCDNRFFVKVTKAGEEAWQGLETDVPYDGAKPYFSIEEPEDQEKLIPFIQATCGELPFPKPKAPKKKKGESRDGKTGL